MSAAPLNAIPLNGIPLEYEMNEIVNKLLSVGDKFISKLHLKQPGFTYSASGPSTTTTKKKNSKIKKNMRYLQKWSW